MASTHNCENSMMSFNLNGKAALVTGAASGVGFATTKMLLQSGATVALNFLPGDARGLQAVAELQAIGKVIASPGDVADPASAEGMISNAVSAWTGWTCSSTRPALQACSNPFQRRALTS